MLYYLLRPITTIALCVFFRKIYITGTENLPQRGPVVFAINHPTAFIDPLPITCFFYRFITHFILRGDMFNSKAVTWALESIKTVPIYRFRDGFDNLRKNQETMERMEQLLANNGNIIIMAEGIRKHEKRMRPIQKGTARMVFGSYGKYQNDEIQIVPVGINFTNALKERSVLMYDFGQPLSIKDYIADYEKNDRRAIKRLTDDISKGMKPRIIHVDNPDDDALADDVLDLFRNDRVVSRSPFLSNDRSLLESELQIIQRFNNLGDAQNTTVQKTMTDYQQTLEQHRLTDFAVAQHPHYGWSNLLGLFLSFPIFLLGYLGSILPIRFAYRFVSSKVKDPLFYASVLFSVSMIAYWLYWMAIGLMLAIIDLPYLDGWGELAFWFAIPITGLFALNYREVLQHWRQARRFHALRLEIKKTLLARRTEIKAFFE